MVSSTAIPKEMMNKIEVEILIFTPVKPINAPTNNIGITFTIIPTTAILKDLSINPMIKAIIRQLKIIP